MIVNWVKRNLPKVRLGDAVAAVAQPIAEGIDAGTKLLPEAMHTNLKNCGGCAQRREALNRLTAPPDPKASA